MSQNNFKRIDQVADKSPVRADDWLEYINTNDIISPHLLYNGNWYCIHEDTISQASATQLELSALLELVAQNLLQTFDTQGIFIALYDSKTNLLHFPYWYCLGQLLEVTPKRAGLAAQIIQSCQPLLINEDYERRFQEQLRGYNQQRVP